MTGSRRDRLDPVTKRAAGGRLEDGGRDMAALVLALGVATIANLQISGAVLYITSSLPDEPFARIMTRYLRRKDERALEALPRGVLLMRLGRVRSRLLAAVTAVTACGMVASAACLFLSRDCLKFLIPLTAAAALNGLLPAGVLSLWMRQVRRMPGRED